MPTAPLAAMTPRTHPGSLRSAKFKGALLAAVVYLVAASPFVLGFLLLSVHEDNFYTILFLVLNVGWMVLWDLVGWPEMTNLTILIVFGAGWTILGFLVGVVVDFRRRR